MESLHDIARHASCSGVAALSVKKFRREDRNFVSNSMAVTVRIHEFTLYPARKITIDKSYDLNADVLHCAQYTHAAGGAFN